MRICILGWYGTETLGDRAILAGLLNIFDATFHSFTVRIGSLYPFLTKRTLLEDESVYNKMAPGVKIDYFDVKNKALLNDEITKSDFIVMGGGPIMDLTELEIIAYAFRYAKKQSKKTAILGCGIGPLHKKQYIAITSTIFNYSDLIILRDKRSLARLNSSDFNSTARSCYAHDPAIIPVGRYLNEGHNVASNHIAVNFRQFPKSCFVSNIQLGDIFFSKLITEISKLYDSVHLVPMHTFYIGGDDRTYLSQLHMMSASDNIHVLHKPMNLYELFYEYATAYACIGMRYHSVVFQTLLNGNNFIFDYTEEGTGKINSFLEILGNQHLKIGRYLNLQVTDSKLSENDILSLVVDSLKPSSDRFIYDNNIFDETLTLYKSEISSTLNR